MAQRFERSPGKLHRALACETGDRNPRFVKRICLCEQLHPRASVEVVDLVTAQSGAARVGLEKVREVVAAAGEDFVEGPGVGRVDVVLEDGAAIAIEGTGKWCMQYGELGGGQQLMAVHTNDGREGTAIFELTGAFHHRYFPIARAENLPPG